MSMCLACWGGGRKAGGVGDDVSEGLAGLRAGGGQTGEDFPMLRTRPIRARMALGPARFFALLLALLFVDPKRRRVRSSLSDFKRSISRRCSSINFACRMMIPINPSGSSRSAETASRNVD